MKKKDLIAFVRKSFRRKDVVAVVILGLLSTLIGVLQPKLNQLIYDDYIALGEPSVVIQVSMVIATFMVGNVFISIVKKLQEYRISSRAGYELQDAVYWRIFDLPENFFRKYASEAVQAELDGIGELLYYSFQDENLPGLASSYYSALQDQLQGIRESESQEALAQSEVYMRGFCLRTIVLHELKENYGLTVSAPFTANLEQAVSRYEDALQYLGMK